MNKSQVKLTVYFDIFWLIVFIASIMEAIAYNGFIRRHVGLPIEILLAIVVLVGFVKKFSLLKQKTVFQNIIKFTAYTGTILMSALLIFVFILEKMKYPNYVYSTFHINPHGLIISLVLTAYFVWTEKSTRLTFTYFIKYLLFALIIWTLAWNGISLKPFISENIRTIIQNPFASYDEKMSKDTGGFFYSYVQFVKKNTPENSKILLPPFPAYPWPQTGNEPYIRYFLYPRTLLNGGQFEPMHDYSKEGIDYVLIAWGETDEVSTGYTHGWPKFTVKSDEIIYFYSDGSVKKVVGKDYNPNDFVNRETWGLIKVKK